MIASGVKDDWEGGKRVEGERGVTGVGGLWLGGEGCVLPLGGRLDSRRKEWEKIQRLTALWRITRKMVYVSLSQMKAQISYLYSSNTP